MFVGIHRFGGTVITNRMNDLVIVEICREGGFMKDYTLTSVITTNGLLPLSGPGNAYYQKGDETVNSATYAEEEGDRMDEVGSVGVMYSYLFGLLSCFSDQIL